MLQIWLVHIFECKIDTCKTVLLKFDMYCRSADPLVNVKLTDQGSRAATPYAPGEREDSSPAESIDSEGLEYIRTCGTTE